VANKLVGVQAVKSVASKMPMPKVDQKARRGRVRGGAAARDRAEGADPGEIFSIYIENSTPDALKSKGNKLPVSTGIFGAKKVDFRLSRPVQR
jgi:hypothetical protein